MKYFRWLVLSVGMLTICSISLAQADDGPSEALTQRLDSLDEDERTLLAPFLEKGPVGLVEFATGTDLPAVIVASYVNASADQVAQVVGNPADYPKFMQTLDSVEVLSRVGPQTSYKWTWRTGVLFLEGENRMTAYGPPKDHPEHGHRIAIHSERGHLGEGRLMWRVYPVSDKRSLAVLAMRVDMRDANFVMKQLDAAARSLNRSINLALCYVMLLGTKFEAERKAGTPVTLPTSVPLERPSVNVLKMKKLLSRGDLLLTELTSRGFGKLSILGRTGLSRDDLWPVMTEPETFGKSLVPGSYTEVKERDETKRRFAWGINLPLIGTEGEMLLEQKPGDVIYIDATAGAMKGGKWRFATPTLPDGEVVIVGWSLFDISRAAWLVQKVAEVDPMMGHGLSAATEVMVLRALRSRAKIEKEQRTGKKIGKGNRDAPPPSLGAKSTPEVTKDGAPVYTPEAPTAPSDTAKATEPATTTESARAVETVKTTEPARAVGAAKTHEAAKASHPAKKPKTPAKR